MKKKIAVLAGICMLVSVQGTVFAADRNSPDDLSDQTVQSVIRADVPDSHKITVKGEHVTVSLEGGNQEENSILVERFSEPKLKFSPEKGWKIKKVLLGDTDVTSQVKDGIITLASVYEDLILTVETEKIKDESGAKTVARSSRSCRATQAVISWTPPRRAGTRSVPETLPVIGRSGSEYGLLGFNWR